MYRNLMNHWWTLAVACVLGLALLVASPVRGLASTLGTVPGAPDPGMPSGPGGSGAGDPDVPTNTGRSAPVSGRRPVIGSMRRTPAGPDMGLTVRNAWLFKIRIALQGVRVFYLRD
jgi:hypothetical protein